MITGMPKSTVSGIEISAMKWQYLALSCQALKAILLVLISLRAYSMFQRVVLNNVSKAPPPKSGTPASPSRKKLTSVGFWQGLKTAMTYNADIQSSSPYSESNHIDTSSYQSGRSNSIASLSMDSQSPRGSTSPKQQKTATGRRAFFKRGNSANSKAAKVHLAPADVVDTSVISGIHSNDGTTGTGTSSSIPMTSLSPAIDVPTSATAVATTPLVTPIAASAQEL
jgi:hypothetical protein